jgi:MFS family permease
MRDWRPMLRAYFALPRRVHLLCLGAFVQRAGAFVVPFLGIDLASRRGLGESFGTLALGVFGAGSLVASLVGGIVADRFGRRPVMLVALFGGALWTLVLVGVESRGQIGMLAALTFASLTFASLTFASLTFASLTFASLTFASLGPRLDREARPELLP